MADTGTVYGDPNAVITRPTIPNFDIQSVFRQFGYYPTQEEIDQLAPTFAGYGGVTTGTSSVANYVSMKKAEADRQKNDPLAALQTKLQSSVDQMKSQVTGLYSQLQDTLAAAPQLFGNMTPDQISTYLNPLQTAFKAGIATVQGAMAGRGLGASSTENNAFAQANEQFEENVFSTGLNVGMTQQQAKAKSIQDQINSLMGLTGSEENLIGSAAGQRSSQNLGQSNLVASLPFFLQQAALQQQAIAKQNASGGGFMDTFRNVTSGISQGMDAFQTLAMVPQQFKTAGGASSGGGGAFQPSYPGAYGPNTPANPGGGYGMSSAGSTLLPPSLSLTPPPTFAPVPV